MALLHPLSIPSHKAYAARMTTEYPNVEITLPLSLDALVAAESQVDVLLEKLGAGRDEELAFALRVIVNEGFRNALVIQPQEGHLKVMRMTLSAGPKGVEVLLREPGRGFAIEGCLPPYPGEHIGREVLVSHVMGERLYARILDPLRIEFRVEGHFGGHADRNLLLDDAKSGGMGIIAICRHSNRVTMEYHPERGNILRAFCLADYRRLGEA